MGASTPGRFSPDGLWWWDGSEWQPAMSPDRFWRWDGRRWVPNTPVQARQTGGGTATAVLVTIFGFAGIIVLVSILVLVVLLTMGNQIGNVFSNVVAALGSP